MDNKEIEKKLQKELRKEVGTSIVKPVMTFIMIALGLLVMYLVAPKPAENKEEMVIGKTLREIPASEGYGYDSAMIIQLENGKEARVPINKDTVFRINKNIEVKKVTSEGGTVSYLFNRYIN